MSFDDYTINSRSPYPKKKTDSYGRVLSDLSSSDDTEDQIETDNDNSLGGEFNHNGAPNTEEIQTIIEILKQFNDIGFKHAIAAGGALRDIDHGKSFEDIKDIDIVINVHDLIYSHEGDEIDTENIQNLIAQKISNQFKSTTTKKDGYGFPVFSLRQRWTQENELCGSLSFEWNNLKIDVSIVPWPVTHGNWSKIADFGLSRISMGSDGIIHKSKDYQTDKNNKAFIIRTCTTPQELENSLKRYERISERYPLYGIGFPQKWQNMYKDIVSNKNNVFSFENYQEEKKYYDSLYSFINVKIWQEEESPLLKDSKDDDNIIVHYPHSGRTSFFDLKTFKPVKLPEENKRLLSQLRNMIGF
jgi:hypothetical protein